MNKLKSFCILTAFGIAAATDATAQQATAPNTTAGIVIKGSTTSLMFQNQQNQGKSSIDFKNAKPMTLPAVSFSAPAQADLTSLPVARPSSPAAPGSAKGAVGNGKRNPMQLFSLDEANSQMARLMDDGLVTPQEFGTSNQVFTTSRVNALGDNTQYYYAFRPTGKLFFNIGTATYVCTGSLIKPGVVVTAAHCVANFGQSQFYTNWVFVPAYNNGYAPYGVWNGQSATVMTSYFNGTDPCYVSGVVCQNDVAVITLTPQNNTYAGNSAGWYGYGWNTFGFNGSGQALINQLGYPVALDGGLLMQRNDSQGFMNTTFSNNTIIGSLMTGGSSGGPWMVNLGIVPTLSGTGPGSAADHNTVVGVTSWGYTNTAVKQQGASPFTTGNIVPLVSAACSGAPSAC